MPAPITLAVIDIGTNSVKATVAQKSGSQPIRVLSDVTEITKLGRDVDADGHLNEIAMQETLAAVAAGIQTGTAARAERIAVVGTSALRDAANRDVFVKEVEKLLGSKGTFEIVSGMREAQLIFNAARRDTDLNLPTRSAASGMPTVIAALDIGGGSTEIVLGYGQAATYQDSLQIGAVRLSERVFDSENDPPTSEQVAEAVRQADQAMTGIPAPQDGDHATQVVLVGSGGTIVNLLCMETARALPEGQELEFDAASMHGKVLTRPRIEAWMDHLATLTNEERRAVRGLEPERADTILAGAILQSRAMRRLGTDTVHVSVRGMRFGLLYDLFDIEW